MVRAAVRGLVLACLLLAACDEPEQVAKPAPQALTRAAVGHYCQMIVADHKGPKAQVFLTDRETPVWFSSVRDAIAFTLLPEEPKNIAALYVNDMARASWDAPEADTWIEAESAHFVIESERRGGMGALEVVPFGDLGAAETFIDQHGGRLVRYGEMPRDYILNANTDATDGHDGTDQGTDSHDAPAEQSEMQHDSTH